MNPIGYADCGANRGSRHNWPTILIETCAVSTWRASDRALQDDADLLLIDAWLFLIGGYGCSREADRVVTG